ncbi:MAG TPA: glycosyltransferase family 9 protein [Micavibrio sp.]|nr:glycosyltransferase family 9 protein [Micavibrio sp.]
MDAGRGRILVIKLGALGDFVQALGPMAAIRRHHPDAPITLLTTSAFESLARQCGYFDEVWIDSRPRWHDPCGWLALRKKLNEGGFSRVYDLQNNDRTAFYLKLFSPRPEWVGAARGASHRNASPGRSAGKAFAGHVQTLALAGIHDVALDDLRWMKAAHDFSNLPDPYVLAVIGAAPRHPQKRWPHFGEFCRLLLEHNLTPVLIGGPDEKKMAQEIISNAPLSIDLTGQTSLSDLPALAVKAAGCIGNDTGPMHLIAPTGCKSLVLFSGASKPERHAPLGDHVATLQKENLEELLPGEVWGAFKNQLALL